jgi:hypothetical protein
VLSKTGIISNAVTLLGHKPIQTLDNADSLVVSAEQAYDLLLPSVLAGSNWRFAVQIQQLSLSVDTPVGNKYKYIYELPADFIKTIRVEPNIYDWEIYENNKIYTNWNGEWFMEYVFLPDVTRMPMYFKNYFVYEIAAYLALSNAQRPDYYAPLEQRRVTEQARAAAADAQNRPNTSLVNIPVLAKREVAPSNFTVS